MPPDTVLPAAIDRSTCPRCGSPNACGMESQRAVGEPGTDGAGPACWCAQVRVSPAARAALPAEARGQACLCRACLGANSGGA